MEDHIVPWVRRWRLGSGIMGEQVAVSIHAHIMRLERTYHGIPDNLERLKYVVREQIIESNPSLLELQPPETKRRKKKVSTESSNTN